MLGSTDGAFVDFLLAGSDDAVGDFADHFLEHHADVAAGAEIAGGDVFHALGVGRQLVAFTEAVAAGVVGVVNGDGVASELAHDGEAGDIRGAVTEIDHEKGSKRGREKGS